MLDQEINGPLDIRIVKIKGRLIFLNNLIELNENIKNINISNVKKNNIKL